MALRNGYGVVIGTVAEYFRDPVTDFGQYYHGNLRLTTEAGRYRCAIDVDSKNSAIGVEWRTVALTGDDLGGLSSLATGYHPLVSHAPSGAVDYVRSPMLAARLGCLRAILGFLGRNTGEAKIWRRGDSIAALSDLEPLVATTQAAGLKAMVFGEPFTSGLGLHNIHQNQGDPFGSQWWAENGIWQDGCTILQQDTDSYAAFLNKFTSQAYRTDDAGHPS